MSEIKLISPLLDGFSVGNPISEHNGVCCYPAIKENTDKKYIIKVISIPASQVQMDALLLAGAYKDPADAMEYFRLIGNDILEEAELLKKLSKLDGFLPYEGWQMEPITRRRLGYQVYLVSSYKKPLDKHLKKHAVTHLEAINLALDLCAALTVCRESGSLYVDLKPSNIFVSDKKEYRIGDLGFVKLDALNYSAMPEKYFSPYTPPELYDPMTALNLTADTYALGMILYQLYNDGQLPFQGKIVPEETVFPSPVNADYEIAEIIMKAIHPNPDERWKDPKELGKALAAYMQRNAVNDVPITPYTPLDVPDENITPVQDSKEQFVSEVDQRPESIISEDTSDLESEVFDETESVTAETDDLSISCDADVSEYAEETPEEEIGSEEGEKTTVELPETVDEEPSKETPAETEESEEKEGDFFREFSEVIEKAEELISHELPEEIVIPQVVQNPDPFSFAADDLEELEDTAIEEEPMVSEEPVADSSKKKAKGTKKFADPKYKRRTKRFLGALCGLLVTLLLAAGAFCFYQVYYLISVNDLMLECTQDQIVVSIQSDKPMAKWIVTCVGQDGKTAVKSTTDGQVTFTELQANTMYTIRVDVDGFHGLVGKTSDVIVTNAHTQIESFTAVAGAEDGSVVLNFAVVGEEPNDWTVFYSTEGEEEKRKTFTGHSVTIGELSIGKVYTFRLDTGEHLALNGHTTLEYMASRLILADGLTVTSENETDILVRWKAPGDVVVNSWNVRCYNDIGYDEQITVSEPLAVFSGIDFSTHYTVEVTAEGMTQPARTGITANPLNITSLAVEDGSQDSIQIHWEFSGEKPKDGWLLIYNLVGGEKIVVKCAKETAEISPKIPGARYDFLIQAADGTTVFNSAHSYSVEDGPELDLNKLTDEMLTINLLKTPEQEKWSCDNIGEEEFTNSFASGDSISIALKSNDTFYLPGTKVTILYVIRDAYGNIVPDLTTTEQFHWKNIWNRGDVRNGELTLPAAPSAVGEYTLSLYFDGMRVAKLPFSVNE